MFGSHASESLLETLYLKRLLEHDALASLLRFQKSYTCCGGAFMSVLFAWNSKTAYKHDEIGLNGKKFPRAEFQYMSRNYLDPYT